MTNSGENNVMTGQTIAEGRYILEEPIGEGRFAIVYRAEDRKRKQAVALKLMREEHIGGDERWRQAFDIEVALLQTLADIPTVVTMLDHGVTSESAPGERPFIILELLPKGTDLLTRLTQEGPFEEREGLPIAWQLADVVCQAHARNIAYRDMKLEHIFWNDGRLTLIDWNVSRQYEHTGEMAFDDEWERERGFKDDLFKLGTMFYSLYTGLDIRNRQLPTPVYSQLRDSGFSMTDEGIVWPIDFTDVTLSDSMRHIIERILHIEVEQRYQSAHEIKEALEAHAQDLGVELTPPSKPTFVVPEDSRDAHPLTQWMARVKQLLKRQ